MEKIEDRLHEVAPEWVDRFYEFTTNDIVFAPEDEAALGQYDRCLVGTARRELGLPPDYDWMCNTGPDDNYCPDCYHLANRFHKIYHNPLAKERRPNYLESVAAFTAHLEEDHGWKR